MDIIFVNENSKSLYQSISTSLTIEGKTKNVIIELRYLEATEKWYISMFDSQTGKSFFRYVPVVSCLDDLNDLILPFSYKNIGFAICFPWDDNVKSVNPKKNNLDQFGLIWGDSYA